MNSRIGLRRTAARAQGAAAYAERRAEIIAAAAQVFGEKGFRGTSLADVAGRIGTDRASLYYYIGSKEEAFHEIVREAAESNAKEAEEIRDAEGSAPGKIRRLITALMKSYAEHPYLFVYIQEDLSRVGVGRSKWSRQMSVINKRYDEAVVGVVEAGLRDGSIRPIGSARVIANGIIGMVNSSHLWYRRRIGGIPSGAEIGETFAEALLNGLSAQRENGRGPRAAGRR